MHCRTRQLVLLTTVLLLVLCAACGKLDAGARAAKQLELAAKYLGENNFEEAVLAYQEVISIDPKNPAAYKGLSVAYSLQGKLDKAEQVLQDGLSAVPDDNTLKLALAGLLVGLHRFGEAEDIYLDLVSKESTYLPASYACTRLLLTQGKAEKAVDFLEQVQTADPDNYHLASLLAKAYLAAGNRDKSLAAIIKSLSIEPDQSTAYQVLDELYSGRWVDLLTLAGQYKEQNQAIIGEVFTLLGLYGSGQYKEAIQVYEQLAQDVRNHAKIGLLAAQAYLKLGDRDRALEILRAIKNTIPQDALFVSEVADLFLIAGSKDEARELANRGIGLDETVMENYVVLYNSYLGESDYEANGWLIQYLLRTGNGLQRFPVQQPHTGAIGVAIGTKAGDPTIHNRTGFGGDASEIARRITAGSGNPFVIPKPELDLEELNLTTGQWVFALAKTLFLNGTSAFTANPIQETQDQGKKNRLSVELFNGLDGWRMGDSVQVFETLVSQPEFAVLSTEERLWILQYLEDLCLSALRMNDRIIDSAVNLEMLPGNLDPDQNRYGSGIDFGSLEEKWDNLRDYLYRQTRNGFPAESAVWALRMAATQTNAELMKVLSLVRTEMQRVSGNELRLYITGVDSERFPSVSTYVTITDALNRPLPDLESNAQFQVWDGKRKAVVLKTLVMGDPRINNASHIALVIDTSGSMSGDPIEEAKKAAISFINMAGPDEAFSLIAFAGSPTLVCGRSTDKSGLKQSITNLGTGGGTALYDALIQAFEVLSAEEGRKVVLVLSDGANNEGQQDIEAVRSEARRSGVSVFAVAVGDPAEHANLAALAEDTGGKCYFTYNTSALGQIYRDVHTLLNRQYKIDYITGTLTKGPRSLRIQAWVNGEMVEGTTDYVPGGLSR